MSKILITGGAGFIGAHLAKALMNQGENIVLFDNFDDHVYSSAAKQARIEHMFEKDKRPRLITGDILDGAYLNTVFDEEKFEKVVHLAALPNPGKSMDAADIYTMVNVNGTVNVLEACRHHDIVQFLFAGSSSVYNDEQTPFQESNYPLRPRSPYGASKAAAELYCSMWHELYGIPTTVLRFFSVYGPWGRPDMAPMIFAQKVLSDEPIQLTPNRKRDFTYIDDIVAGIMASLEKKCDFEIMNLGRGEPVELMDFIEALEKASRKKARIESRPEIAGEMRITYADISKARQILDYHPSVSIQEGAGKLIAWMQEHPYYNK